MGPNGQRWLSFITGNLSRVLVTMPQTAWVIVQQCRPLPVSQSVIKSGFELPQLVTCSMNQKDRLPFPEYLSTIDGDSFTN
ncbi:hypothetical protein DPMN_056275 [Dreissena polymorpha]|uniref:Uncharacterized protein n=1 Tax=Dreissena polymorpha TaxID=45954 RepID=A0A9D4CS88_DREPO|nr:hypothetical protein DPMN_056275 [Dreissena polymorpha]